MRIFNTHAGCERSIKPNFPIICSCFTYHYIGPSFIDASATLKKIEMGTHVGAHSFWSRHLLMLNHTTVISFFGCIKAFSVTWCNFGARLFAEGFFIEKNSKWGHLLGGIHLISQSFNAWPHDSNRFFVGIKAFSLIWCNFGENFFAEGFFIEKNSMKPHDSNKLFGWH